MYVAARKPVLVQETFLLFATAPLGRFWGLLINYIWAPWAAPAALILRHGAQVRKMCYRWSVMDHYKSVGGLDGVDIVYIGLSVFLGVIRALRLGRVGIFPHKKVESELTGQFSLGSGVE